MGRLTVFGGARCNEGVPPSCLCTLWLATSLCEEVAVRSTVQLPVLVACCTRTVTVHRLLPQREGWGGREKMGMSCQSYVCICMFLASPAHCYSHAAPHRHLWDAESEANDCVVLSCCRCKSCTECASVISSGSLNDANALPSTSSLLPPTLTSLPLPSIPSLSLLSSLPFSSVASL